MSNKRTATILPLIFAIALIAIFSLILLVAPAALTTASADTLEVSGMPYSEDSTVWMGVDHTMSYVYFTAEYNCEPYDFAAAKPFIFPLGANPLSSITIAAFGDEWRTIPSEKLLSYGIWQTQDEELVGDPIEGALAPGEYTVVAYTEDDGIEALCGIRIKVCEVYEQIGPVSLYRDLSIVYGEKKTHDLLSLLVENIDPDVVYDAAGHVDAGGDPVATTVALYPYVEEGDHYGDLLERMVYIYDETDPSYSYTNDDGYLPVGKYLLNVYYDASVSYVGISEKARSFTFDVTQKELTIDWNGNGEYVLVPDAEYQMVRHYVFHYTAAEQAPAVALDGVVKGDAVSIDRPIGDKEINADSDSYAYEITSFSGADAANYKWAAEVERKIVYDIAPRPITIAIYDRSSVYGDAPMALTADESEIPAAETETIYSLACDVTATSGVGTYRIIGEDLSDNYVITFVSAADEERSEGIYTVQKKKVTISYNDTMAQTATYGIAETWAAIGNPYRFISADVALPDGDLLLSEEEENPSIVNITFLRGETEVPASYLVESAIVGDYKMVVAAASDDYDFTFAVNEDENAHIIVTAKEITVTADDKVSTYGDALEELSATIDTFIFEGDDPSSVYTLSKASGTNAGEYVITVNVVENPNYTVTPVNGKYTIKAKAVTVTAANQSSVYGDPFATLTAADTGIVTGDAKSAVYTLSKAEGGKVGEYVITVNVVGDPNYAVTPVYATYTIYPRSITVTAENKSSVYGDALLPLTAADTGIVTGDAADAVYILSRSEGSDAGNYTITVGVVANANYIVTPVNGTYTIRPKEITVTAENKTSVYGESLLPLTAKDTGIVAGDQIDTIYTLSKAAGILAGDYAITVGVVGDPNYVVTPVNGTYTIAPKAITVTAEDKSSVYGDALAPLTATDTGILPGDAANTVYTLSKAAGTNAGAYEIIVKDAENPNYTVTLVKGTYTILPREVVVAAEDKASNYGEDLLPLTYIAVGVVGDEEVCTLSTAADKTKIGTYPITPISLNDPNYLVTVVNGTYTVRAKADSVTVNDEGETVVAQRETVAEEAAGGETGITITDMIRNVLDAAGDADVVTLEIAIGDSATVTFDKAAIESLADEESVVLTYRKIEKGEIESSEKAYNRAEIVIKVSLSCATEGGRATVSTAFEDRSAAGKKAVLYRLNDKGEKVKTDATFGESTLTFETASSSVYLVEYRFTGGAIAGIVVGSVVGAAGIAVGAFFYVKKRKKGAAASASEQEPQA